VITAKSTHGVAHTSLRRLDHPAQAGYFFGLGTKKSFCLFLFLLSLHPLEGATHERFGSWKKWPDNKAKVNLDHMDSRTGVGGGVWTRRHHIFSKIDTVYTPFTRLFFSLVLNRLC